MDGKHSNDLIATEEGKCHRNKYGDFDRRYKRDRSFEKTKKKDTNSVQDKISHKSNYDRKYHSERSIDMRDRIDSNFNKRKKLDTQEENYKNKDCDNHSASSLSASSLPPEPCPPPGIMPRFNCGNSKHLSDKKTKNDNLKHKREKKKASPESSSSDSSNSSDSSDSDSPSSYKSSDNDSNSSYCAEKKKPKRKHKKKHRKRKEEKEKHKKTKHKIKKSKKKKKRKKEKSTIKKKKKERKDKDLETEDEDYGVIKNVTRGAVTEQWGKYGYIEESDMWIKKQEFQLWLLEVKDIILENLSSWEEKQHFKEYMEDFNTATLPHTKYYNLAKWEHEYQMKNKTKPKKAIETTVFNDEEKRNEEIKEMRKNRKLELLRGEYIAMKQDDEKVETMRRQKFLQSQMSMLFKIGRTEEAQKIQDMLKPEQS